VRSERKPVIGLSGGDCVRMLRSGHVNAVLTMRAHRPAAVRGSGLHDGAGELRAMTLVKIVVCDPWWLPAGEGPGA
jgi:hypothetical protein